MAKRVKRGGRPPGGPGGEKVRGYHQLTIRVAPDVVHLLTVASGALSTPRWKLISNAVKAYVGVGEPLSPADREVVDVVLKHRSRKAGK